jgi:DNA-binding LacI/PurR family transcriptional regulator
MAIMRDVAALAGVSIATVSFVVNDTKPVAPATRARVEAAMAELGFRRNLVARALASRKTRIIALLFPALDHRLGATGLEMVTTAARTANELGYHLVLWPASNDAADLDGYVAGGLVDGVILMEVQVEDARVPRLEALGIPFALMGRTEHPERFPHVDIDFNAVVDDAMDHLEPLGHRRIALVVESTETTALPGYGPAVRTEQRYEERIRALGEEPVIVRGFGDPLPGSRSGTQLVAEHPDVTAVLLLNELGTTGLLRALRRSGRSVPDDVSLMLLAANEATCVSYEPAMTGLLAPSVELGAAAVRVLIDELEGNATERAHDLLPSRLFMGESTGPVRPARGSGQHAPPGNPGPTER